MFKLLILMIQEDAFLYSHNNKDNCSFRGKWFRFLICLILNFQSARTDGYVDLRKSSKHFFYVDTKNI